MPLVGSPRPPQAQPGRFRALEKSDDVIEALPEFRNRHACALALVYTRSGAARWNLSEELLAEAIHRSAASANPGNIESYLAGLHAEDLALATACRASGACGCSETKIDAAWNHLVEHYRPILYASARAIVRDDLRARELADSLYADLYGLEVRAGKRRSLLDYFHGRSSLRTWLGAVLAQRHIDSIRAAARTESLDLHPQANAATADPPDPERSRYVDALGQAVVSALADLPPDDRMRLGYYYRHGLSLKEIGRIMGEHESSVSRKLNRARESLRDRIERSLRELGLSNDQIRLCYDYGSEDLPLDLDRVLAEAK
ncbi:MAG TPA: sigma-70 family RNA polymerase sigma factor [Candidatus Binataceae bacterium]